MGSDCLVNGGEGKLIWLYEDEFGLSVKGAYNLSALIEVNTVYILYGSRNCEKNFTEKDCFLGLHHPLWRLNGNLKTPTYLVVFMQEMFGHATLNFEDILGDG